ncbi:MAG TPA: hypothetical protein VNU47_00570 [Candidatus Paceibacterota bacterium]|nr:hypothetical protein [Candidatus Paceibacterota bacterium]
MQFLITVKENLSPGRLLVFAFTILYTAGAGFYFASIGNTEFLGYIAVIVALLILGGCVLTHQCVPVWLFALVSSVGFLHLLGAAMPVGDDILYNYVPFPIESSTGLTFIKMDQIVHTYGSAVAALLAYFFLRRDTEFRTFGLLVFTILAASGVGALNEVIEFTAKLLVPNTDVGGYYNTALDLVVNTFGAALGALGAVMFWKRAA